MHRQIVEHNERWLYDLRCPVPTCHDYTRLFFHYVEKDADNQPVPADQRGPFIEAYYGQGHDYRFFCEGGLYILKKRDGKLSVEPYSLIIQTTPLGEDHPRLPDFGFKIDHVFWLCPPCDRIYRRHQDNLVFISVQAARSEGHEIR